MKKEKEDDLWISQNPNAQENLISIFKVSLWKLMLDEECAQGKSFRPWWRWDL